MKKFIKYCSTGLVALALGTISLMAQSQLTSVTLTNNSTNAILTNAAFITKIQVVAGNVNLTNALVKFYDVNGASNTYVAQGYTNFTEVLTNITSVSTNSQGDLQTNVYPGTYQVLVTNALATNTSPIVFQAVPIQNQQFSTSTQISTYKGLSCVYSASSTNPVTLIITWNPPY